VQLANVEAGHDYRVDSVYERDHQLLEFLDSRGIRPRARVRVVHRNYDQTLTLETEAGNVPLGHAAAENVWLERKSDSKSSKQKTAKQK
jgi:DtxR family Mn-dependent transcriptional regulator